MKEYKELFQRACLLQFSVKSWQCSKVIDQSVMRMKMGSESEWLRGRKYLINPELLGQIHTATHQARNVIQRHALPFPITSIYLIPKESLKLVDERLEQYKQRFWHTVDEFVPQYMPAREEARLELGELYNDDDYPENITKRFNFEWRYLALGIPGKTSVLTPEIYEREKEKFENLINETRELALAALREEFGDVIGHLVNRLSENGGKPKIFKGNMFNKLHEFLDEFGTRNLFQDDLLMALAEQAKTIISGTSAYNLQYNQSLRDKIQQDMLELKASINESIVDVPRRKLRLAA